MDFKLSKKMFESAVSEMAATSSEAVDRKTLLPTQTEKIPVIPTDKHPSGSVVRQALVITTPDRHYSSDDWISYRDTSPWRRRRIEHIIKQTSPSALVANRGFEQIGLKHYREIFNERFNMYSLGKGAEFGIWTGILLRQIGWL